MKFKLEESPKGILVCHIIEPLEKKEAEQVITGVGRVLANGKARVILEFSKSAAIGPGGAAYLEKGLRKLRDLACKMNGDILYVIPEDVGVKIPGVLTNLSAAIHILLGGKHGQIKDQEKLLTDLYNQGLQLKEALAENALLSKKTQELLALVREPSADAELKSAVEHYKKLAMEVEEEQGKSA